MKRFLLTIVFLVPISILLFLQIFGNSEFRIPLFYSEGVVSADCGLSTNETYSVRWLEQRNSNNLITISKLGDVDQPEEIKRIVSSQQAKLDIQILVIRLGDEKPSEFDNSISVDSAEMSNIRDCEFLVSQQDEFELDCYVLTDSKNQIRGYYRSDDLEEIDRLLAEVDILRQERVDD